MRTTLFGWAAGALGVVYNVPQMVHIWRTKTSDGISPIAVSIRALSYVLYVVHGLNMQDYSLLIMTAVSFVQVAVIAAQIRYYRKV